MIFCTNKIFGKVWKIKKEEKYLELQMTTSEKDQQSGEYRNSSWFPRCIGHAFNSLKDTLKAGDRIVITKSKFTNERYTAHDGTTKSAFRFVILEAEIESQNNNAGYTDNANDAQSLNSGARVQPENNATAAQPTAAGATADDDCPW